MLNLAKKSSLDNTLSLLLPIEQRQLSCWAAQKKKKLSLYHVSFFCFLFYSHFYSKATLFQPLLFFFTLYFSCAIVLKKKKKSNKQIKFKLAHIQLQNKKKLADNTSPKKKTFLITVITFFFLPENQNTKKLELCVETTVIFV